MGWRRTLDVMEECGFECNVEFDVHYVRIECERGGVIREAQVPIRVVAEYDGDMINHILSVLKEEIDIVLGR